MIHFNCRCNPNNENGVKEAINKWAKAKGIDPERVFAALDIPKARQAPLSEIVKGSINTSVFEDAIIE